MDADVVIRRPSDRLVSTGHIAAPMLEDITKGVLGPDPTLSPPRPFASTSDVRTRSLAVCEDTTGEKFRETGWERRCDLLCPDGFAESCAADTAREYCYWQIPFSVNVRDIDSALTRRLAITS